MRGGYSVFAQGDRGGPGGPSRRGRGGGARPARRAQGRGPAAAVVAVDTGRSTRTSWRVGRRAALRLQGPRPHGRGRRAAPHRHRQGPEAGRAVRSRRCSTRSGRRSMNRRPSVDLHGVLRQAVAVAAGSRRRCNPGARRLSASTSTRAVLLARLARNATHPSSGSRTGVVEADRPVAPARIGEAIRSCRRPSAPRRCSRRRRTRTPPRRSPWSSTPLSGSADRITMAPTTTIARTTAKIPIRTALVRGLSARDT